MEEEDLHKQKKSENKRVLKTSKHEEESKEEIKDNPDDKRKRRLTH